MRENERKYEAFRASFSKTILLNNELNVYKVFSGLFHTTKPITNYQNIQLIIILHEDKLGRNKNNSR